MEDTFSEAAARSFRFLLDEYSFRSSNSEGQAENTATDGYVEFTSDTCRVALAVERGTVASPLNLSPSGHARPSGRRRAPSRSNL